MKTRILTISRQYGSGGRKIGEQVAKELGIAFYDKKLINLAAEQSGLSPEFIKENEERITNSFLYNLSLNGYYANSVLYGRGTMRPEDVLFLSHVKIVQDLAGKEPCVIVGRCADYILRERRDALHVFVYSDEESRAKRAVHQYGLREDSVAGELRRRDKARSNHYNHYTGQVWGAKANYHLCLNSDSIGAGNAVKLLKQLYNMED